MTVRALAAIALACAACAACGAKQHGGDPACGARWEIDRLEQWDPLTETFDVSFVEPGPIWSGDLDRDGQRDVILRYRGSRTHAAVVMRACGAGGWQVLVDEVRATQVGTAPGEDGWLDLVLVDGKHRVELHHGKDGYEAPAKTLGEEPDWQ